MKLFVVERFGTRPTAVACMAVALIASVLAFAGGGAASAQEPVLISEEVTTQSELMCAPFLGLCLWESGGVWLLVASLELGG